MTITLEMQAALAAPFALDDLEWRFQSYGKSGPGGSMLPYVTARAVMDRLDSVAGPAGWSDQLEPVVIAGEHGWLCKLCVLGVERADVAPLTDIEPLKGGASDALKRAAVKFGIGRYLYFMPRFRVQEKPRGGWRPDSMPAWALPGGAGRPPHGRGAAEGPDVGPAAQSAAAPRAASQDAQGFDWREGKQAAPQAGGGQGSSTWRGDTRPSPEQQARPTTAPAQRGGRPSEDHNSPSLPPNPPPFLDEPIKFGKYRDQGLRWGDVAIGDAKSARRSWLRWVAHEMQRDSEWKVAAANRCQQLLEWLGDETANGGDGGDPHGWPAGPDPDSAAADGFQY